MKFIRPAVAAFTLVCAAMPSAIADPAADAASLRNFRLTPEFLAKWESFDEAAAQDPCHLLPMPVLAKAQTKQMSLDQMVAAYDAQPGVHAALAQHGLTAREAMMGMMTLMAAATQDLMHAHPEMVQKGEISMSMTVSKANMDFYHAHAAEMRQHQMKVGQEELKRNHGKLPACFADMGGH